MDRALSSKFYQACRLVRNSYHIVYPQKLFILKKNIFIPANHPVSCEQAFRNVIRAQIFKVYTRVPGLDRHDFFIFYLFADQFS